MKTALVLLAVSAVALCRPSVKITHNYPELVLDESAPAVHDGLINTINNAKSTWTAAHNKFSSWTIGQVKKLMGVKPKTPRDMVLPAKSTPMQALPTTFDSRINWPQCPSTKGIRDQGSCGSCWAVSASEALTDRWCIGKNGAENPWLSAEELTSCCGGFKCFGCDGCNGGQLAPPWNFASKYGIVTGGLYGDNSTCQPYLITPCEHHVNGTRPPCAGEGGNTPACSSKCYGNGKNFADDRRFFERAYKLATVEDMMQDLFSHGPIQVAFSVYEDFLAYSGGVYQHVTGNLLGGHAVKVIGWGTENGVDYWLVANSWNTDWPNLRLGGFFKIRRGVDECGIEDDATAGIPKIN